MQMTTQSEQPNIRVEPPAAPVRANGRSGAAPIVFTIAMLAAAVPLSLTMPLENPWIRYGAGPAVVVLLAEHPSVTEIVSWCAYVVALGVGRAFLDHGAPSVTRFLFHAGVAAVALLFARIVLGSEST